MYKVNDKRIMQNWLKKECFKLKIILNEWFQFIYLWTKSSNLFSINDFIQFHSCLIFKKIIFTHFIKRIYYKKKWQ